MNDLQFFNTPAIVDVDGDGRAEVIQGSAMYDVRAYGLRRQRSRRLAQADRRLERSRPSPAVTSTATACSTWPCRPARATCSSGKATGPACGVIEWPKYQHDLRNTGTYGTDGRRPGAVLGLVVDGLSVKWKATGDDGPCGTPAGYDIVVDGVAQRVAAGVTSLTLAKTAKKIAVSAVDDMGARGFPAVWPPDVAALPASTAPAVGVLPTTGQVSTAGAGMAALLALLLVRRTRRRALSRSGSRAL